MRKPSRQCRGLSEVSFELDNPKVGVNFVNLRENLESTVPAAVVDNDYFITLAQRV